MNGTNDDDVTALDATWPDLPSVIDTFRVYFTDLESKSSISGFLYAMESEGEPEGKYPQFARRGQRT